MIAIAIVNAFNDPNIVGDLGVFDTAFGLPAPPSFTGLALAGLAALSLIEEETDG